MQDVTKAVAALVVACKNALEADDVFKAEGVGARRAIRSAVAEIEGLKEPGLVDPTAREVQSDDTSEAGQRGQVPTTDSMGSSDPGAGLAKPGEASSRPTTVGKRTSR